MLFDSLRVLDQLLVANQGLDRLGGLAAQLHQIFKRLLARLPLDGTHLLHQFGRNRVAASRQAIDDLTECLDSRNDGHWQQLP